MEHREEILEAPFNYTNNKLVLVIVHGLIPESAYE